MAELATIARPYAEALYKVLSGGEAQPWLDELAQVGADADLLQFAADPKVSRVQIQHVVEGVLRQPMPPAGQNFLCTVVDNDRLAILPQVAAQYRALVNGRKGVADAVVQSAFALDAAALEDLKTALEKRFGRPLNLTVEVQPELIGGVRVSVGDEVLDTSVQARLSQMKAALIA